MMISINLLLKDDDERKNDDEILKYYRPLMKRKNLENKHSIYLFIQ